jgi:hypothetical protein
MGLAGEDDLSGGTIQQAKVLEEFKLAVLLWWS